MLGVALLNFSFVESLYWKPMLYVVQKTSPSRIRATEWKIIPTQLAIPVSFHNITDRSTMVTIITPFLYSSFIANKIVRQFYRCCVSRSENCFIQFIFKFKQLTDELLSKDKMCNIFGKILVRVETIGFYESKDSHYLAKQSLFARENIF